MAIQRFSGQGYHKVVDKTATINILFQMTIQKEGGTIYLYATNADLTTTTPTNVTTEEINPYKVEKTITEYFYTNNLDLWVYFSSEDGYLILPENPVVTTVNASINPVKLSTINPAHFPLASGGGTNLTPFLSVADITSSVVISTSADTTFMQFLANNQSQNDTSYFSYATNTLTILQAGLYNFNIGINAEKSSGGNGNLEIKLLVNDVLGKNSVGLIQIDNDGTIASAFSGSVILNANDTVKLVFQNQGTGILTATTTATKDAFRLQVFKIGN